MNATCRVALVFSLACGALLAAASPAHRLPANLQSQAVQQKPVFRSGVDVVRVDVYPRRRDRVVENLAKEDFELTEDGVRQTIETFDYIAIDMDRGLEPLDPRSASEARHMAEDPRNRVFVFYLDTYEITMEGSARAREPLLAFLQRNMGPHDLFAWMTPRQSPEFLEFTRSTQDLSTLMTVARPWGEKDTPVEDPEEMKLMACAPSPPNAPPNAPNVLVQAKRTIEMHEDLKELIIRLGALRQERKNLVILGERWMNTTNDPFRRAPEPAVAQAGPVASRVRGDGSAGGPLASLGQRGPGSFVPKSPILDDMRFCSQVSSYLRGRRVFTTGQELIDLARRNNVSLYFVSLAPATLFNFNVAGSFADATDGRSLVSNDIFGSLQTVLDHQTGFYMLGYRSTAGEAGKQPRVVRVRTTRSGVDLDVRRIYDPPPPEFVAARNAPKSPVERTDVEKAIDRLPPLREDAELSMQALRRSAGVEVTVEVASRVASAPPWTDGGIVTVSLRDEQGGVIVTGSGAFAGGQRAARLLVPAPDAAKAARATTRVEHASGATLGDSVPIESPLDGSIGAPVFYRAGSLPRLPFLPAADLTFGRTERVRLEWPLAAPVADPVVALLNTSGTRMVTDGSASVVDLPDRLLRADLRLLSLAPGVYVVEVSGNAGGLPVRLLTAIRVTR